MTHGSRTPGLYDELITKAINGELQRYPSDRLVIDDLEEHAAPLAFTRLLHGRIYAALKSISGDEKLARQLRLADRIIDLLAAEEENSVSDNDKITSPPRQLLAVLNEATPPGKPIAPPRPVIPLSTSDLLVNGPHDLSIGPEIRREIASADRIDLLCAFVKFNGLRLVEKELRELCARTPKGALRVLTTTYMRATDRRALDTLVDIGADVRVSYDTGATRLHAKAWLFHRDSGYSTGFVGSSNLSPSAMLDGVEWNVRLSEVDNGAILEKFRSTFEQYWDDAIFQPYVAADFDKAIMQAQKSALAPYLFLDVQPRPHQAAILEELEAERERGHWRNLVVAATGTGKTIVAALDYKRLRGELKRDRLLFIAHRREILEQSLTTFRVVLRDGSFGETLVGGSQPDRWTHVFASIQSMSDERLEDIAPDHFDVIIVDEFHHAAASSYDELLQHFKPKVLLGLTATPERADGKSILHHFGGRIASELRLWDALDDDLLSPFHYFGIGGAPNLKSVKWSGGRYDARALSNVYTADNVFALRVAQETAAKVKDVSKMRALGFCVDVEHAKFMAAEFTKRGIKSAAVFAATKKEERRDRLAELRAGELQCIFSVDLFNEGVDLPNVDTVLFLRPTESATVFLQQLGRGLRRSDDKECLTVLDFIGDQNRKFRFDLRFRAMIGGRGGTRRQVQSAIEQGFPSLPSGCVIQLDRAAQASVIENIRSQLGIKSLRDDLRALGPNTTLRQFLDETELALEDIYVNGRCWTSHRREAGFDMPPAGPDDGQFERALGRMLHIDDSLRLNAIQEFLKSKQPVANPDGALQRLLFMLLGYTQTPLGEMQKSWDALWSSASIRDELVQLLEILDDRARRVLPSLPGGLKDLPLRVHATYTLDEILAAFDERTKKGGVKRIQTGVFHAANWKTDLLFITLEKSAKDYSPTTLYNDYAISARRFHWESQSNCHADTPTGRRYVQATRSSCQRADKHVLLFVRTRNKDPRGETMPYMLLGPGYYLLHRGGEPMQIEWELEHAMPAALYQETKVAAG